MATYRQPSPPATSPKKRAEKRNHAGNTASKASLKKQRHSSSLTKPGDTTSKAHLKKSRHTSPHTKTEATGKQLKTIAIKQLPALKRSARNGRFQGSYKL